VTACSDGFRGQHDHPAWLEAPAADVGDVVAVLQAYRVSISLRRWPTRRRAFSAMCPSLITVEARPSKILAAAAFTAMSRLIAAFTVASVTAPIRDVSLPVTSWRRIRTGTRGARAGSRVGHECRSERRILLRVEEHVGQRRAPGFRAEVPNHRPVIVLDVRVVASQACPGPGRSAGDDPPGQQVRTGRHARHPGQDQAEQAGADHDDADDVQVYPEVAPRREREPEDRSGREEEDTQAGAQRSPTS